MFKLPGKIIKDIENYRSNLEDFLNGRASFSYFTGTRVPWGIYSHRGKKVFMSRLRIPAGSLSAEQLKAIAYLTKTYGDGFAHITTRQDIQIHGVKIEDTIKILDYLKSYNLSSRGGGGNTVRNITACSLSGICKDEVFEVKSYAIALSEYLLAEDASYNLPRKFKIAFSGCNHDCAGCLLNDLGFRAKYANENKGFEVYVAGGLGKEPRTGHLLEEFIPKQDLGFCVCAVRNIFYKHGDRKNKHHNRLRFLIEDLGLDNFKKLYKEEFKELKEKEYIALRNIDFDTEKENNTEVPKIDEREFGEFLENNTQAQKQKGFLIVQLRIPRGDISAESLNSLSGLEKDFPGIEFSASQNQNLYILWVKNGDAYRLFLKLKTILTDFLYPETLLDVVACKGALTCNLGLCNSPGLAKEFEDLIKGEFIGKKVFKKLDIKLNGCPNSCGQAPIGKLAFYGMVKMVDSRPVPFYKFIIGGRREGEKTKLAEDLGVIPAKNIPGFLRLFLSRIEGLIKEDKEIYEFLETKAKDIAKKTLEEFSFVPSFLEDKNFYIDWGKTEEFSLEGLGPGECGAGVLDLIESDLIEAKIALEEAENKNYPADEIKKSLLLACRALLVVKGRQPKSDEEALNDFTKYFVQEQIASLGYSNIKDEYSSLNAASSLEEKKNKFLYAKGFLGHINHLYKGMDSSFNFPKQTQEQLKEQISNLFLDLKGTPCPINYVKSKLFLENLEIGARVEILLDEGEPIVNVPKSLEADGHKIIKIDKQDGFYRVIVEKGI